MGRVPCVPLLTFSFYFFSVDLLHRKGRIYNMVTADDFIEDLYRDSHSSAAKENTDQDVCAATCLNVESNKC